MSNEARPGRDRCETTSARTKRPLWYPALAGLLVSGGVGATHWVLTSGRWEGVAALVGASALCAVAGARYGGPDLEQAAEQSVERRSGHATD